MMRPGNARISKGLEGIEVDETAISLVDGERGVLSYRGISIDALVERGWLTKLPDGTRREDAVVTEAAFYTVVARMLADGGLPGGAVVFTGTPWRIDPLSTNAATAQSGRNS